MAGWSRPPYAWLLQRLFRAPAVIAGQDFGGLSKILGSFAVLVITLAPRQVERLAVQEALVTYGACHAARSLHLEEEILGSAVLVGRSQAALRGRLPHFLGVLAVPSLRPQQFEASILPKRFQPRAVASLGMACIQLSAALPALPAQRPPRRRFQALRCRKVCSRYGSRDSAGCTETSRKAQTIRETMVSCAARSNRRDCSSGNLLRRRRRTALGRSEEPATGPGQLPLLSGEGGGRPVHQISMPAAMEENPCTYQ